MAANLTIISVVLLAVSAGCSAPSAAPSVSQAIFGQNDLTKVPYSDESIVQAVGLMKKGCTVSHIGNGLVLTAGHCIALKFVASESSPCGMDTEVTWAFADGHPDDLMVSHCLAVVKSQYTGKPEEADYALLRYDPAPASRLALGSGLPAKDDKITLYSYPMERTLEWSGWCNVVTDKFGKQGKFGYLCDTEQGSSGAPILDQGQNIIGVHDATQSKFNYGTPVAAFQDLLDKGV